MLSHLLGTNLKVILAILLDFATTELWMISSVIFCYVSKTIIVLDNGVLIGYVLLLLNVVLCTKVLCKEQTSLSLSV